EKEETEVTEVKEETEKTEETDFTGDTTKKLDPTSEAKRQATTVTVSRAAPSNPILSQPTLTVGNPGYIWSQPSSSQNTPEAQAPDLPANSAARGEDLRDEGASSNLESNTPLETENTSDTTQEMANEPISSTDQATHAAEIPVEPKAGNEISQSDQTTEAAENPVEPKPGSENSLDILNPLSQYAPCPLTGQGHGTISQIRTAFEAPNRFLIFLEVKGGQFGSLTSRYDHEAKPAVFISTFEGHFKTLVDFVRGFNGPVEMVRVSLSDNSLDLSVIFLDAKAPKSASMEALCRQETMVLIYTLAPDDAPIDQTKSP
ncbi:MAG: hypothetical protein LBE31_07860, partial [Deltaproteobacteria bacterium]|nr:hypothetical protein [Deltaproteobacteria bacterium]